MHKFTVDNKIGISEQNRVAPHSLALATSNNRNGHDRSVSYNIIENIIMKSSPLHI